MIYYFYSNMQIKKIIIIQKVIDPSKKSVSPSILHFIIFQEIRLTMNRCQVFSVVLSFLCYFAAFLCSFLMPASRALMGKKPSTELVPLKVYAYFVVGTFVWGFWIGILWVIKFFEGRLRPHEHKCWGKVCLLLLGAPGLTIFPVLSVYCCTYFTGTMGATILVLLALSSFLLQLMFLQDNDYGMMDMLEAVHLPILPTIKEKYYVVILISFIYYGRKFLYLIVQEIIKRRRRRNQQVPEVQLAVVPAVRVVAAYENLQLLCNVANDFATIAQSEKIRGVFNRAYVREEIDNDTLVRFKTNLDRLVEGVGSAREYLNNHEA